MAIIGNPKRFAVEYRRDGEQQDVWLYGNLCYWVAGERVGDFDAKVSLRDFLLGLEKNRRHYGQHQSQLLSSLPARWVVELLAGVADTEGAIHSGWARHTLSFGSEAFDDWQIYLVELENSARLLYRFNTSPTRECLFERCECDEVLEKTLNEIWSLYVDELIQIPRVRP